MNTCIWDSLPEIVISVDTTVTFKRRLDKFWKNRDILYNYKVELTGVWSRSQINVDDNIGSFHFFGLVFRRDQRQTKWLKFGLSPELRLTNHCSTHHC